MLSSLRRVLRSSFVAVAALAAAGLALPESARAQGDECNGLVTLNYLSGPAWAIAGDEYRVRVRLGTDAIIGGTANELSVERFRFALECSGGGSVPCTDEGDIIRYVDDSTITSTGCVDTDGLGVTWSSNGVDSPAGPNEVVFTPSAPVVLAANTAPSAGCEVQFDVRVETTPGLDASPLSVQESVGYVDGDATCDTTPPTSSVTAQTGQIRLCPACADGECFDEACNQETGLCERTNDTTDTACEDTDQDACTLAFCDGEGECNQNADAVTCEPGDECFENVCDPADGLCKPNDINEGLACGDTDGSACTTSLCEGGACNQAAQTVTCTDSGECFVDVCDPADGQCKPNPTNEGGACTDEDGTLCTIAQCVGGACDQNADAVTCDPGGECFENLCDPADGLCKPNDINEGLECGDTDGTLCTTALCEAGSCNQEAQSVTCDPDGECFSNDCNPATGVCDRTNAPENDPCTDTDNDLCTTAACDDAGNCQQEQIVVVCEDPECQECDPETGECVDLEPLPLTCGLLEVCRTPGFWKNHAGVDPKKKNSQDIVGALLASVEGGTISVCGEDVSSSLDAMENMCVPGGGVIQLKRQLTAAALNCIISGGGPDCEFVSIGDTWLACNELCQQAPSESEASECIELIDCFNNGKVMVDGSCEESAESCKQRDLCPLDEGGAPFCFEPPGPAGSAKQCKDIAKGN